MSSLIIPKLLPICILLSLVLAIINWVLSFIQIKLPYSIFKFFEILLTLVIAFTITITLIDYHVVINREHFSPTAYIPFGLCLFAVQTYYAQQNYKISYVFITNFVTLLFTLIALNSLPTKIFTLPIMLYYLVHTIVLLIWSSKNHEDIMALVKKQTWVNNSKLINSILPKKNINTYMVSCVASFCYSSLNLCILVSIRETGITEYVALLLTCAILIFTSIISFSLLVKYDGVDNEPFPGCLLIHFITQAYTRCENIISSEFKKSHEIFTLRSLFFAIILIVDALGSTCYAVELQAFAPTTEQNEIAGAVGESRYSGVFESLRRTFSLPNMRSAAGSVGAGVTSAYIYDQAISNQSAEDPQVIIARLEEQVKAKDALLQERRDRIEFLEKQATNSPQQVEVNKKSFFNSLFACFKK